MKLQQVYLLGALDITRFASLYIGRGYFAVDGNLPLESVLP